MPDGLNAGSNLVAHAVAGDDDRVHEVVTRMHPAYLRDWSDLACRVTDERNIRGLSKANLAMHAGVAPDVLNAIERGKPVDSVAAVRRVLRALDVEPAAIPSPGRF